MKVEGKEILANKCVKWVLVLNKIQYYVLAIMAR